MTELSTRQLTGAQMTHPIGSGSLLVRDEAGNFRFIHQSVLEWLIANRAAEELRSGKPLQMLSQRLM